MRLPLILLTLLVFLSCRKDEAETAAPCIPDNYLYYSDYFVFVADDGGTPLVIPMDVNWSPTATGYSIELKGWHGTENEWPIGYYLNDSTADLCAIPQEAWEHANTAYFQFNSETREIFQPFGVRLN